MKHHAHKNGFTLVETLIALSVFAIIASASTGVLTTAIQTGDMNERASQNMATLSLARSLMRDDFLQLVLRPARDPFGNQTNVAFEGGFLRDRVTIVRFSRRGRVNPGGRRARGGIQHVQYLLEDQKIVRRTYPQIDPTPETQSFDQTLFEDVARVNVRFLKNGFWQEIFEADNQGNLGLPVAIEMVITFTTNETIRFVFHATGERIA